MNKHLHRIVFNAARGLRMVVQETARSTGASLSWGDKRNISTFFPPSWSEARITYEVTEAFKVKIPDPKGGGTGTTPSGIDIRIFWDSKNQRTTFYPIGK